ATGSRSASRMIATIRSSVNLDFRIAPSLTGATLSRNRWSEIPEAGHGHQLLQPYILRCQLPQTADVIRSQLTEPLAPSVDRLLADPVPLRHIGYRIALSLPDDR